MTITGDSFGYDATSITAVWSDGTECVVTAADMTWFTCTNARFTTTATNNQDLTITVNGVSG